MKKEVTPKTISLESICFAETETLREVLKKMTNLRFGFGICIDTKGLIVGIMTDGDVRRAFLNGKTLDTQIGEVINREPKAYQEGLSDKEYRELLQRDRKTAAPVINAENVVVDYVTLSESEATAETTDQSVTAEAFVATAKPIDVIQSSDSTKIVVTNEPPSTNETILVTGGAGYIGSILCRKLLSRGYNVRVLDKLVFGKEPIAELLPLPNFELIEGDMCHIDVLDKAVFGVDRIIHLAAIVGDPACALEETTTIVQNCLSTKVLAEIAKNYQVKQLVFASSCSVYGGAGSGWIKEDDSLNPLSLYAETRLQSEYDLISLRDDYFYPTILRLSTVYGLSPRMRFDLVVNILTAEAIRNGKIRIMAPELWRPFVHVSDAAEAFVRAILAPRDLVDGEIFNVGDSKENYTIGKLGKVVQSVIPDIEVVTEAQSPDQRSYRVSCDKITKRLGYTLDYSVVDGVREIANMLQSRSYLDHYEPQYSNVKTLADQLFRIG